MKPHWRDWSVIVLGLVVVVAAMHFLVGDMTAYHRESRAISVAFCSARIRTAASPTDTILVYALRPPRGGRSVTCADYLP